MYPSPVLNTRDTIDLKDVIKMIQIRANSDMQNDSMRIDLNLDISPGITQLLDLNLPIHTQVQQQIK